MALTNQEPVRKAVELLRDGLKPLVGRELVAVLGVTWAEVAGPERGRRGGETSGIGGRITHSRLRWTSVGR
jgi:hypothetical protein